MKTRMRDLRIDAVDVLWYTGWTEEEIATVLEIERSDVARFRDEIDNRRSK